MEVELMRLTELDAEKDTASCNICFAHNYDPTQPGTLGERVDRLYKLKFGCTVVTLCDACLDRLSAMLNTARQLRDHTFQAGADVWVVERDGEGNACDVSGYMFLAEAGGRVIVSPYINSMDDLDGIMEYHVKETAENYDTDLSVFPAEDCWPTREAAHVALNEERGGPETDKGFHDEAGGYHEGGCGWDPNGHFCGECSNGDCGQCPIWTRDTAPGGNA